MSRTNAFITAGLIAGFTSAASVLAAAADANTAQVDPSTQVTADSLEEVVVTAQNRSQDVQDVPIVIDVVNAEELKNAGFADMNDIDTIAPVVQLNQDQGTVKVTMRGVGTNSNDEAQDTSIVMNIDGEYINRPRALGVALFDMERVEVLRGPQGTLYGRNSTGGAINFITRKPGGDFGGDASASYGNYNAWRVDGGVDIPLGDIGGVRVAGFYDTHDGYVEHPANSAGFSGGRSDDNEAAGGRVSMLFKPTNALSINLAAEYAERDYTPQVFAYVDLHAPGNAPTGPDCNAPGYVRVAPAYTQTLCVPSSTDFLSTIDRGEYTAPLFGLGRLSEDTYAIRGRLDYEFSQAATLTYIGGYRSFSGDEDNYLTLPVVYRSFGFASDSDTQSHELRLNGEIGNVVYQVGGFYFEEDLYNESGFFLPIGPNGTFLSYFGRDTHNESWSLFGQTEYSFTEKLTAVGGLRYTDNKRSGVYQNAAPFGPTGPDPALFNAGPSRKDFSTLRYLSVLNLENSENKTTWLIGLNYKPDTDKLAYGKISTGFKAGGFDSVGTYKPESNTAYEAGWKQNFGSSSQYQFNFGGYYYDYKDLQVSVLLDTTIGGQTFNAGKATIWGLETSGDFQLNESNRVYGSVNYLNAKYDELFAQFNVYCVDVGCGLNGIGDLDPTAPGVQQPNFAGNRPPFSPEFIVTLGYDHIFNLGGAGTLTAQINSTLKSSYFTDFYNYKDGKQDSLTQTDFNLIYQPEGRKFTVQAYIHNIEDNRALTYGSFVSAGPDDIYNWQFGTPQTYGIRVSANF